MKSFTGAAALLTSLLSLSETTDAFVTLPMHSRKAPRPSPETLARIRGAKDTPGVNVPVADWIKHTADLQWYTPVKVGTPPQTFNVIFDTGSFDMFIASTDCTTCGTARLFDSKKSSTFSSQPGDPQSFQYATGVDSTSLPPQGEGVEGNIVTDRVDIANLTVPSQQFLLCDRYDEFLSDVPFDGVMGIGLVNVTGLPDQRPWYWNLYYSGQLSSPAFSLYYPRGKATGAEMTLGGVNPARHTGDIKYIDLVSGSSQFDVNVPVSYFNGKKSVIPAGSAILDSGTPFLTADRTTTAAIYASISSKFKQIEPQGSWGAPCDVIESLAVDMTFTLGSGKNTFNVTMPKSSFNLGPYEGHPGICQSIFSSLNIGGSPSRPVLILGAPVLEQYYTVWDGLNAKMGFGTLVL